MRISVLLFAGLKDAAGKGSIDIEVQRDAAVSDVIDAVADQLPQAEELVRHSRLAVDGSYASDHEAIAKDAEEFALIPPVSGG